MRAAKREEMRKARQEGKENAQNAKLSPARAKINIDKQGKTNYNKKKFSFQHKNFPGEQVSGSGRKCRF